MSPLKTSLTSTELSTLTHVSSLLQLAHHRNKNQHRRAAWYRPFSILRRHLGRIKKLFNTLAAVPDTHAARHRKKTEDKRTEKLVDAELQFFKDVLVPRCWKSFSQLVADGRFAVLGTVLLACLAEVGRVTGVTIGIEEDAQRDVELVLERFAEECAGTEAITGGIHRTEAGEDVGMVVARRPNGDHEPFATESSQDHAVLQQPVTEEFGSLQPSAKATSDTAGKDRPRKRGVKDEHKTTSKKRKKKRAGGDDIDDLFAGL